MKPVKKSGKIVSSARSTVVPESRSPGDNLNDNDDGDYNCCPCDNSKLYLSAENPGISVEKITYPKSTVSGGMVTHKIKVTCNADGASQDFSLPAIRCDIQDCKELDLTGTMVGSCDVGVIYYGNSLACAERESCGLGSRVGPFTYSDAAGVTLDPNASVPGPPNQPRYNGDVVLRENEADTFLGQVSVQADAASAYYCSAIFELYSINPVDDSYNSAMAYPGRIGIYFEAPTGSPNWEMIVAWKTEGLSPLISGSVSYPVSNAVQTLSVDDSGIYLNGNLVTDEMAGQFDCFVAVAIEGYQVYGASPYPHPITDHGLFTMDEIGYGWA